MRFFLTVIALAAVAGQSLASSIVQNSVQDVTGQARQTQCGDPSDAVTLLRGLRNTSQTAHLYTTDPSEMEQWIDGVNGQSQGDAARVFAAQQPSTTAVYRVHDSQARDNLYTTSSNEVSTLVAEGWTDYGVYWYTYTSQVCGSVPFYVVDNPTTTDHVYTTNITERNELIDNQGYVDEGIAMYVLPLTD